MRQRQVQIEEQKIDDVTVEEAVGEIAENAREQQAERDAAPGIARFRRSIRTVDDDERDAGERDEKAVVVPEGTEGGAGIGDVNEGEEIGRNRMSRRLGGVDEVEDQILW